MGASCTLMSMTGYHWRSAVSAPAGAMRSYSAAYSASCTTHTRHTSSGSCTHKGSWKQGPHLRSAVSAPARAMRSSSAAYSASAATGGLTLLLVSSCLAVRGRPARHEVPCQVKICPSKCVSTQPFTQALT